MEDNYFNEIMRKPEVRAMLESYYKWIVNLSIFILTISVSIVGMFNRTLYYSWLIVIGWSMLAICIILNWLIVKRIVSFPLIDVIPEEERDLKTRIFAGTMPNIKIYANFQNGLFLFGTLLVFLGFMMSWLRRTSPEVAGQVFTTEWFSLVRIGLLYDMLGALVIVFSHLIVGNKKILDATLFYEQNIRISSIVFDQMDAVFGFSLMCIGFIMQILGQDANIVLMFSSSQLHLPYVVLVILFFGIGIYAVVRKPIGNKRIATIEAEIDKETD